MSYLINAKDVLLVITLGIAFLSKVGTITVPSTLCYLMLLFWIVMAIGRFLKGKRDITFRIASFFSKQALFVDICIYAYTLALVAFGLTESKFLSTNLQTFIDDVAVCAIFYVFRKKTFNLSVLSLGLAYLISVLASVISGTNFLEFHDIAFASGFVIIYYFMGKDKLYIKDLKWIIVILAISLLAFKRIEIFALVSVVALYFVLNLLSERMQRRLLTAVSLLFVIMAYIFIAFTLNNQLLQLADSYGINLMGRNYYYSVFTTYAEFSPSFIGLGRNAMAYLMTNDYSYMRVGNIHSDILRMYAECGFWMYIFWLWFNLFKIPRKVGKYFGFRAMKVYMLCTFYVFVTYFTDNTELYLVTNYFYMLVPIWTICDEMEKGKIVPITAHMKEGLRLGRTRIVWHKG